MASLSFNDTSTKLGIVQSCESMTGLGDAGISGVSQLLKEFTRYTNKTQSAMWSWIFEAYGGWQFEDSNQTNLPAATDTIASGQTSYALPTGTHGIRGIEVKNTGGVWFPLMPVTEEQIRSHYALGQFFSTSGMPTYYQLVGDSVRVFPASNYTQAASFKVFFDREMVAFTSSDTTRTAGIPTAFHDAIPVGAVIEWYKENKSEDRALQEYINEFNGPGNADSWKKRIQKYYSRRFQEMFPPRLTVRDYTKEME